MRLEYCSGCMRFEISRSLDIRDLRKLDEMRDLIQFEISYMQNYIVITYDL
jgi:hypothetical protein